MSGTEWGDVASWAAFALAGGAFVVSLKARGDSKKSADATVRAASAAEESVAEARRSADASIRSAAAAESSLELQQQDAEERRRAQEEAQRPRVDLRLMFHEGSTWHLVNDGTAPARNLQLRTQFEFRPPEMPANLILDPGAVQPLRMIGTLGAPRPAVLEFTWEGQDDPVRLRVPPKT
ncbi:hypothetical protein E3E14_16715 [Streptomyces sp. ICN441]|uniref:hypothetical protein n=1 Tax=Streptomyces sp. ICN441 TaxID=2558286 RepID=UPI00106C603E|nr:hypothetical protein [Streptomyces sp. ICN441]TFE49007.1 hypothetical protein E3E14_16715 [Streptomyces sp. ICN441]